MTLAAWPATRPRRPRSPGRSSACVRQPGDADSAGRGVGRRRGLLPRTRWSRRRCGCDPVIPIVVRRLKEPMEIGGATCCPPASRRLPAIYLMHRRPDVYPEPATRSARSASWSSPPAPTPGSRSAAGSGAAWARASRCSRCRWCSPTLVARLHLRPADAARRAPRPADADHPRARSRGAEVVVEPRDDAAHHASPRERPSG